MNSIKREDFGQTKAKRRGYDVSEPCHPPKRARQGPPRDKDADYYGPAQDHDDKNERDMTYALGWECKECQAWNQGDLKEDSQCHECGLFASSVKKNESDEESELDEFGRRRPPPAPPTPRWPPNFETHGSAYVLDNRSGMFYESKSKFFYDPTTKLYYSHDKQAYFRHRLADIGKSVFDKVENTESQGGAPTAASTASTDKQMMLPAISINLKTKVLPKKSKKRKEDNAETKPSSGSMDNSTANATSATRKTKEHEADLAKWSERQTELNGKASRELSKIPKTAKGEPICSLCQRKFPNLDKLFYHERVSELHKINLAKQAQKTKEPTAEEKKSYVDRAEQRRLLHGPENAGVVPSRSAPESAMETTTRVDPKETLNETNIGNKMLQKLGWQQGKGLGRRTAAGANDLQQDWERIERLAASNSAGRK